MVSGRMSNISSPPVLLCTTFLAILDRLDCGSVVGEYFALGLKGNVGLLTENARLRLVEFVHLFATDRECDALKHGKILHEVSEFLCMFVVEPTVLFANSRRIGRFLRLILEFLLYACKHWSHLRILYRQYRFKHYRSGVDYIAHIHRFSRFDGIPMEDIEPASVGSDTILRPPSVVKFLYREEYLRQLSAVRLVDR